MLTKRATLKAVFIFKNSLIFSLGPLFSFPLIRYKHRKEICKIQWISIKWLNSDLWRCLFSNKCTKQIINISIFRIIHWWWSCYFLISALVKEIFSWNILWWWYSRIWGQYFIYKGIISSIAGISGRIISLESGFFVMKRLLKSIANLDTMVLFWVIWWYIFVQLFLQPHFFPFFCSWWCHSFTLIYLVSFSRTLTLVWAFANSCSTLSASAL